MYKLDAQQCLVPSAFFKAFLTIAMQNSMLINIFSRCSTLKLLSSRREGAYALHRTTRSIRRLTSCELTQNIIMSTGSLETGRELKDDLTLKQVRR